MSKPAKERVQLTSPSRRRGCAVFKSNVSNDLLHPPSEAFGRVGKRAFSEIAGEGPVHFIERPCASDSMLSPPLARPPQRDAEVEIAVFRRTPKLDAP